MKALSFLISVLIASSLNTVHASTSTSTSTSDDLVWAGYKAKLVCSGIFISGRKLKDILGDMPAWDLPVLVDRVKGRVETQVQGEHGENKTVVALYRGRKLGCTLLPVPNALPEAAHLPKVSPPAHRSVQSLESGLGAEGPDRASSQKWPEGKGTVESTLSPETRAQLRAFLDHEFSEDDPTHPTRKTRAIVVVHKGRIIAERYAESAGITRETPLIGWSMTKSITSALIGILVDQRKLALNRRFLFPQWNKDKRGRIALDDLLRMGSGLDFVEADTTARTSDVTRMLFLYPDTAAYMLQRPPLYPAKTQFNYSTGDSILLSHLIRLSFRGDQARYDRFPFEALLDRIGMESAVFEQDASGLYLGGTNLFATARDWARFGLLYLRDGVWNGEQLISKNWIRHTRAITPYAVKDAKYYGAHFWLVDPGKARRMGIPGDTFLAAGFMGQGTFIIPSRDLVVVRMGWTEEEHYDPYGILQAVARIKVSYLSRR